MPIATRTCQELELELGTHLLRMLNTEAPSTAEFVYLERICRQHFEMGGSPLSHCFSALTFEVSIVTGALYTFQEIVRLCKILLRLEVASSSQSFMATALGDRDMFQHAGWTSTSRRVEFLFVDSFLALEEEALAFQKV